MRPQDKPVFSQAAREFNCWILVRQTNADSLKYVGMANHTPKPIECKAKTASNKAHHLVGLVVNPKLVPEAIAPDKKQKALEAWESFEKVLKTNRAYAVVTNPADRHYGCVTLNGKYIHGDYDLKDVILDDQMHRNLASVETLNGQSHMRGPLILKAQKWINSRLGSEMVQHGGEAQYTGHSDEPIDLFGPNGETKTFANGAEVRAWYDAIKRQTITPVPNQPPMGKPQPWTPVVIKGGKS
jgi:hypothetical protein